MKKHQTPSASLKLICSQERETTDSPPSDRAPSRLTSKLEQLAASLELLCQESANELTNDFSHFPPELNSESKFHSKNQFSLKIDALSNSKDPSKTKETPRKKNHLQLIR